MPNLLIAVTSFLFITIASKQIGEFLTRFNLPLISGYLLAGIVAGPFILDLIHTETLPSLRFIDELALAFIAYAAGSEMVISELRSRIRSIAWHTLGQLLAIYSLGSVAVYLLSSMIPFMQDMGPSARLAVALMAGSILVARSPSSAIAIVNELRAKGPFTKTVLGVTIMMDVVVVVVFAISTSIADVLLLDHGFDLQFVLLLVLELGLALMIGVTLGRFLGFIHQSRLHPYYKRAWILLTGYGVFVASEWFRHFTHAHLPYEVFVEPLLVCMVASFWLTNFSPHRDEFSRHLHDMSAVIYVMFFTLVGDALQLDVLARTWQVALALFVVRMVAIFIGTLTGGALAGDPGSHNRLAWMTYITQAGIGLGLAKEVAVEFPEVGEQFATVIISVIVVSQLVGPPFFKYAIKKIGEARLPGQPQPDEIRDAVIIGIDAQSRTLAWRLKAQNWELIMADMNEARVRECMKEGIESHRLSEITPETISTVVRPTTDAVVMMFNNDALNYKVCETVYETFGTKRLIVRLNDYSWAGRFTELGAQIIYPASAVVSLMYQVIRAPHTAAMLMQTDAEHQLVQVTVRDRDVDGLRLRDLRLPSDVLVLEIMRNGRSVVAHGYTELHLDDDVTLVGRRKGLDEATRRLGY